MIARLLYAAVALCLLGTWPERAPNHPGRSVDAPARTAGAVAASGPAGIRPAPADFAIPRNSR